MTLNDVSIPDHKITHIIMTLHITNPLGPSYLKWSVLLQFLKIFVFYSLFYGMVSSRDHKRRCFNAFCNAIALSSLSAINEQVTIIWLLYLILSFTAEPVGTRPENKFES